MSASWLVGEYGDTLRVSMPFSVSGATVVLKVRLPAQRAWSTWAVDAVEDRAVEHVIVDGELAKAGTYRGAVEVLAGGRLRKAIFQFTVGLT